MKLSPSHKTGGPLKKEMAQEKVWPTNNQCVGGQQRTALCLWTMTDDESMES